MPKLFMFDPNMADIRAAITPSKLALMFQAVSAERAAYLQVDSQNAAVLNLDADVIVTVGKRSTFRTSATAITAAHLDSGNAFQDGASYAVFVCDPDAGDNSLGSNEVIKVTLASNNAPSGYTAQTARKIGGFTFSSGAITKVWTLYTSSDDGTFGATFSTFYGATQAQNATLGDTNHGAFTAAHSTAIRAGDFSGFKPGDKFTINEHSYLIGECDYAYRRGTEQHHLLLIPETAMYNARMNASNTTASGYYGSEMYVSNLVQAKEQITADFGADHILGRYNRFSNAANSSGVPTSSIQVVSMCDLMSELQVFGAKTYSKDFDSAIKNDLYAFDDHQIALFVLDPSKRATGSMWWLRDVYSSNVFCVVYNGGSADVYNASYSGGVRPAFLIY